MQKRKKEKKRPLLLLYWGLTLIIIGGISVVATTTFLIPGRHYPTLPGILLLISAAILITGLAFPLIYSINFLYTKIKESTQQEVNQKRK